MCVLVKKLIRIKIWSYKNYLDDFLYGAVEDLHKC